MKKIREFIVRKPLLSSIVLVLIIQCIFHLDIWFLGTSVFENMGLSELMAATMKRIITSVVCMVFMTKVFNGSLKDIGYKLKDSKRGFMICLIALIFVILLHAMSFVPSIMNNEGHFPTTSQEIRNAIEITIECIFVGFFEETAYRLVTINTLRNKECKSERGKMFYCLIFSSILFGLIHLYNIIGGYETILMGTATIINAMGFGMLLGAMYWVSGSIVPSIILHFLWDLLTFESYFYIPNTVSTVAAASSQELAAVIFACFTALVGILSSLFILRKKKYEGCKIEYKPLSEQD